MNIRVFTSLSEANAFRNACSENGIATKMSKRKCYNNNVFVCFQYVVKYTKN